MCFGGVYGLEYAHSHGAKRSGHSPLVPPYGLQVFLYFKNYFLPSGTIQTFKPQNEKTKQDCVEEQRIMDKVHHEKHGYSIFTEENFKDRITAVHHFGKENNQKLVSDENINQEREKDLSYFEVHVIEQNSTLQNLLESRLTTNEDFYMNNGINNYNDLKISISPESTGQNSSKDGDDAIRNLHDHQESAVALIQSHSQQATGSVTSIKLLRAESKETKSGNNLSKTPADMNDAKAPSNNKKSQQRNSQPLSNPVKSKITYSIPLNTDYPRQFSQMKNIHSDFEGSGYSDFQDKADHLSPLSGDDQPFKYLYNPSKEEAIVSGLEDSNIQTEFSDPNKAETIDPDTKGAGYNEPPEKEENGRNISRIRTKMGKIANIAGVSQSEGSNDIIGSTNFKELPGKDGQRVDASSQNAHQGKVKFLYPHTRSKEERKEVSSYVVEATNHNTIPKQDRESHRKEMNYSSKNQAISSEKQELSSKGQNQDIFIPSPGIDNEIVFQIGPGFEWTVKTHRKKGLNGHQRQNTTTWNNIISQRKVPWVHRKPYSNRLSSFRKPDSSESSSDSSSSSESEGD
ncbi:matrix extracellular phosphoglycoprotein [Suncus etruscus]|uniref:matrix extracellular phosphoglycoprotein n=1 Tax=Suncus etruscus TaxID=109475 RepID=UPI002110A87C|nr:matrix extracellular phosphoglycoprotein [Suncus etruscus]